MFTIVPDNNEVHVRAILSSAAEIEQLIDKLMSMKEKVYGRHDNVPAAISAQSVSGTCVGAGGPDDVLGLVGRNGTDPARS